MIHESVHAYILYKNSSDAEFMTAIKEFGKKNGFNINQDPNRFHHEFMGKYVKAMAYSLYYWDKYYGSGGELGWDYYYSMAFGGLFYIDSNDNYGKSLFTDPFKIEAVKALAAGGEVDFNYRIIKDSTFIGTKAECVYNKLQNLSTNFKNAIQKFDGEFPVAHLKYSTDYNLPNTTNAVTNNVGTNNIEIKINGNTLPSRTVIGIARTLIHETIHAELYRKVRSVGGNISVNDFPGIYDYYRRYVKNWQHEQMAGHYRQIIVDVLKEFDNNQHSSQFYNDLAWEGLHGTTAWNELLGMEQARIKSVISNYKNSGNKKCN